MIANSPYLILGLGNPGKKFCRSRHNIGFSIVDDMADRRGSTFISKKRLASEVSLGPNFILAKPQTFMNESGEAARKLLKFYKIPLSRLFVIHDEIDLPFGTIRLSRDSGAAGHKGIQSIIGTIGKKICRVRVGIENRAKTRIPPTDAYVLQPFSAAEERLLKKQIIPRVLEILAQEITNKNSGL